MKSPNMMSTTGRMPVIAAPTPRPAMPGSEIGESMMRLGPNSSTKPESTLNGVPASATSSPMMNTQGSRRSSSARASRIAWPRVSMRVASVPGGGTGCLSAACERGGKLGVDMLVHLAHIGIWRRERELDAGLDLGAHLGRHMLQYVLTGDVPCNNPLCCQLDGVALGLPALFLFLGAVVCSLDVADVVP